MIIKILYNQRRVDSITNYILPFSTINILLVKIVPEHAIKGLKWLRKLVVFGYSRSQNIGLLYVKPLPIEMYFASLYLLELFFDFNKMKNDWLFIKRKHFFQIKIQLRVKWKWNWKTNHPLFSCLTILAIYNS